MTDCEAIAALVNSGYRGDASREGWTTEADLLDGKRTDAEAIEQTVSSEDGAILLIESEGPSILGCISLERRPGRRCYFGMLTIRPGLQALGLGRKLLERAERFARDEFDAEWMEMVVISARQELIAWYERRGYARTGRRIPFSVEPRFGIPRVGALEMVEFRKRLS